MKRIPFTLGILIIISGILHAQELSLDDILQHHYEAVNMEKLGEVSTIVMEGLRVQQDIMPMKIIRKRPDRYLLDFSVVDLRTFQAYDGDTAWSTAPWTGNQAPLLLQGSRARDLKYQADFDGMLYHWKEKGHHLELQGIDTLDTGQAYRLKLIRADSAIQYYFIGCNDFLLKKQQSSRTAQGQEITIETFFRDYRTVEGIPFAFVQETRFQGRSVSFEIETIDLNVPVDDKVFRMTGK